MKTNEIKKAYFIGIGGIGMSAIARYLLNEGIEIHGYDKTQSTLTKKLESEGMKIHYDIWEKGFPENLDLVIYTPAIPKDHFELNYFLASSIPVKKRSEMLGIISRGKRSMAIAGTHGKTSTSAILSHILTFCKLDASAFVGGIMVNYSSNFIHGQSDLMVLEADEYDRSFLRLSPQTAAIISIDPDHLDIYGDHEKMLQSGFVAFVDRIEEGGNLIVSSQAWKQLSSWVDERVRKKKLRVLECGIEEGDCVARNIRSGEGKAIFDFEYKDFKVADLVLGMPGEHNIQNATIAISIAMLLGLDGIKIRAAIGSFKGIKRRFEKVFEGKRFWYIDDYAHHPSELKAAIQTARTHFPKKRILGIFQPHLYSRTRDFAEGFIKELNKLDVVVMLPIYPAREKPIEGVGSSMIYEGLENVEKYLVPKNLLLVTIENIEFDVIMTLGAGDIDELVNEIKAFLTDAETI